MTTLCECTGPRSGGQENHFSLCVNMARQPRQHARLGMPCRAAVMCLSGTVSCIPQGCFSSSLKEQTRLKKGKTRRESGGGGGGGRVGRKMQSEKESKKRVRKKKSSTK